MHRRAFVAGAPLVFASLARAQSVADFYRGKTITMIVGFAPGGVIDTSARITARHLTRFIPGTPNIIIQTIDGAMPNHSGMSAETGARGIPARGKASVVIACALRRACRS